MDRTPAITAMDEDGRAGNVTLQVDGNVYRPYAILLSFFIVIANVVLIQLLLQKKQLRKQRHNLFLLSLAWTDLGIGLLLPFASYMDNLGDLSDILKQSMPARKSFCLFTTIAQITFVHTTIWQLVAIGVDRLRRIRMLTKYGVMKISRRSVLWILAGCWLIGVAAALILNTLDTRDEDKTHKWNKCTFPFDNVCCSTNPCNFLACVFITVSIRYHPPTVYEIKYGDK